MAMTTHQKSSQSLRRSIQMQMPIWHWAKPRVHQARKYGSSYLVESKNPLWFCLGHVVEKGAGGRKAWMRRWHVCSLWKKNNVSQRFSINRYYRRFSINSKSYSLPRLPNSRFETVRTQPWRCYRLWKEQLCYSRSLLFWLPFRCLNGSIQ